LVLFLNKSVKSTWPLPLTVSFPTSSQYRFHHTPASLQSPKMPPKSTTLWDHQAHLTLLMAVMKHNPPSKDEWETIITQVQESGYDYTPSAVTYACLSSQPLISTLSPSTYTLILESAETTLRRTFHLIILRTFLPLTSFMCSEPSSRLYADSIADSIFRNLSAMVVERPSQKLHLPPRKRRPRQPRADREKAPASARSPQRLLTMTKSLMLLRLSMSRPRILSPSSEWLPTCDCDPSSLLTPWVHRDKVDEPASEKE
jgi:hypothetical protein